MQASGLHARFLTFADLAALQGLRNEVLASLPNPDLYVREADEPSFLKSHIDRARSGGEAIGVFDGGRLAAYGMLSLPLAHDPDNLGCFLGYEPEQLAKTAHLASCMVSPAYRGRQLQRFLLSARMSLAMERGRDVCIAMVSLLNHNSRANLLREGLRVVWVGEIGGVQRQLMAAELPARAASASQKKGLTPRQATLHS